MIFLLGIAGIVVDKILSKHFRPKVGWLLILVISFILYCVCFKRQICPWFSIDDIINFGWIFVLGILYAYYNVLARLNKSIFSAICAFGVAVIVFLGSKVCTMPLYFTNAVIAVIMIYSLCEFCSYFAPKLKIRRNSAYAQTLTIFLLSWPCQAIVNMLLERLFHCPYYIIKPFQFWIGVIMPMLIIWFIRTIETRYNFHYISVCLGNNHLKIQI
jgi:membrane protein